ncbi:hypothetical protein TNCV_4177491 [Trichonephila clavipes]|nr:hypothetical protein TNCV_4177491 [Trichonephila clavipes]
MSGNACLSNGYPKGRDQNASPAAEIVNGVYGADTVTASYVQFGFVHSVQPFLMGKMHLAQAETSVWPKAKFRSLLSTTPDRFQLTIEQKQSELANSRSIVFHQDNAKPYMSVKTCQKLWEFG